MLSIKDINEVSFRKSNFSGYNSDDVDQFIDEVLETVTALTKENAEIKTRKTDDSAAVTGEKRRAAGEAFYFGCKN